jgi:hypothetical protein
MYSPLLIERDHSSLLLGWNVPSFQSGVNTDMKIIYQLDMLTLSSVESQSNEVSYNEEDWQLLSSKISTSTIRKKNLIPDTPYIFRVRYRLLDSIFDGNMGEWSPYSVPSEPFFVLSPETKVSKWNHHDDVVTI